MILLDFYNLAVGAVIQQCQNGKLPIIEKDCRYVILNSIRARHKKFKHEFGEFVIAGECKKSWRKQAFPHYKANRRKYGNVDWTHLYKFIGELQKEIVDYFPFKFLEVPNAEGDDIIAVLAQRFQESEKVLIISKDKDFGQLQKYPNIFQFNTMTDKMYSDDHPEKTTFEHVLKGDSIDGIPNILSDADTFVCPEKKQEKMTASRLELLTFKPPTSPDIEYDDPKFTDKFDVKELHKNYKRNRILIDFDHIPDRVTQSVNKAYDNYQKPNDSVFEYLTKYELVNLLSDIQDFG